MKLMKLAVILGLAGSTLATLSSPAQAFKLYYDDFTTTPLKGGKTQYNYFFRYLLEPSEKITLNQTNVSFDFTNQDTAAASVAPKVTGTNVPTTNSQSTPYFTPNTPTTSTASNGKKTTTQKFTANLASFYNDPQVTDNEYYFEVYLQSPNIPVTGLCVGTQCVKKPGGFTPDPNVPIVAVPEAESALVPVLALGFGYLYRSKKRKNLQVVATKAQEHSLV